MVSIATCLLQSFPHFTETRLALRAFPVSRPFLRSRRPRSSARPQPFAKPFQGYHEHGTLRHPASRPRRRTAVRILYRLPLDARGVFGYCPSRGFRYILRGRAAFLPETKTQPAPCRGPPNEGLKGGRSCGRRRRLPVSGRDRSQRGSTDVRPCDGCVTAVMIHCTRKQGKQRRRGKRSRGNDRRDPPGGHAGPTPCGPCPER